MNYKSVNFRKDFNFKKIFHSSVGLLYLGHRQNIEEAFPLGTRNEGEKVEDLVAMAESWMCRLNVLGYKY